MKIKEIDQIGDKIYKQIYYLPNDINEQLIKKTIAPGWTNVLSYLIKSTPALHAFQQNSFKKKAYGKGTRNHYKT